MKNSEILNISSVLKEILLKERELLVEGRANDALSLKDQKENALENLTEALQSLQSSSGVGDNLFYLKDIIRLAKANEIHFIAVRNGLRNLMSRLASTDASSQAGVYNQYGNQIRFSGATGGYIKKI